MYFYWLRAINDLHLSKQPWKVYRFRAVNDVFCNGLSLYIGLNDHWKLG